jgi:hypothetical protein
MALFSWQLAAERALRTQRVRAFLLEASTVKTVQVAVRLGVGVLRFAMLRVGVATVQSVYRFRRADQIFVGLGTFAFAARVIVPLDRILSVYVHMLP